MQVARQKVMSAQSDLANMLAQLGGDPNLPVDEHPTVQKAQAALDKAEYDLERTVVRAPQNGIVTKVEQLQVGSYVNAAAPVFPMISDRVWIEANFKETELTHMRPGQTATVSIDTYPDAVLEARVESLSPGTGLTFSLLPAENATGNWVKVVQRLPVRLSLAKPDRRPAAACRAERDGRGRYEAPPALAGLAHRQDRQAVRHGAGQRDNRGKTGAVPMRSMRLVDCAICLLLAPGTPLAATLDRRADRLQRRAHAGDRRAHLSAARSGRCRERNGTSRRSPACSRCSCCAPTARSARSC